MQLNRVSSSTVDRSYSNGCFQMVCRWLDIQTKWSAVTKMSLLFNDKMFGCFPWRICIRVTLYASQQQKELHNACVCEDGHFVSCGSRGSRLSVSVCVLSFSSWVQSSALRCAATETERSSKRWTGRTNRGTSFWPEFRTYWIKLRSVAQYGPRPVWNLARLP